MREGLVSERDLAPHGSVARPGWREAPTGVESLSKDRPGGQAALESLLVVADYNECIARTRGRPAFMAILTIRNLDDALKARLRLTAARHGCSMEEEARRILKRALIPNEEKGLASRIHEKFASLGGVDLELRPRSAPRPAPDPGRDER